MESFNSRAIASIALASVIAITPNIADARGVTSSASVVTMNNAAAAGGASQRKGGGGSLGLGTLALLGVAAARRRDF